MKLDMKEYWEAEGERAAHEGRWGQAAYNYCHAGNVTKMREALEKAIWSNRDGEYQEAGVEFGLLASLKENRELELFLKNVSQKGSQHNSLTERQRIHLAWLIRDLIAAHEALRAADLFLQFHKFFWKQDGMLLMRDFSTLEEVTEGLLAQRQSEKAIKVCKVIMDEDSDDLWPKSILGGRVLAPMREAAWERITKFFLDARAKEATREICRLYFNIRPSFIHVDREIVAALKDLGEWSEFLEDISKAKPLDLGHFLSKHLSSELLGLDKKETSELEVGLILRCYEAVGSQEYLDYYGEEGKTTEWLGNLICFWEKQGDKARAAELGYRHWEDVRRIGRKDFETAFTLVQVAYQNADQQNFGQAAELMEKAGRAEDFSKYPAGFHYQAAKLYERAGDSKRAAGIYEQFGRFAKVSRLRGTISYDMDEVRTLVDVIKVDDYQLSYILESARSPDPLPKAEITVRELRYTPRIEQDAIFGDWVIVPILYKAASGKQVRDYAKALHHLEKTYRNRGRWVFTAKLYLFGGFFDDFDRLCLEEDELEIAALWYEQANMPERAAKIYDLMGQSGKSGKAQAEGAKQKPLDTAEPKSDSTEELKGEDSGQPVCAQCGAEVKAHWTACPKCDADLQQRKCKNCGEPLESDWKRCPVCKTPI